jgi:SAM-dependent methyltransferase
MKVWPHSLPATLHAVAYHNDKKHCRDLIYKYYRTLKSHFIVEIGATDKDNCMNEFNNCKYINIDIVNSYKLSTFTTDITKSIPIKNVDLVYCKNVFEHISKPWLAARRIIDMMNEGGILYLSTVWAWRYHPIPEDYWHFSLAASEILFEHLHCYETNFNIAQRREDIHGYFDNKLDAVPLDGLGGRRENWRVYFFEAKLRAWGVILIRTHDDVCC